MKNIIQSIKERKLVCGDDTAIVHDSAGNGGGDDSDRDKRALLVIKMTDLVLRLISELIKTMKFKLDVVLWRSLYF